MTLLGFGVKKGHQTKNEMPFKNIIKIKILDRGEGGTKGFQAQHSVTFSKLSKLAQNSSGWKRKGFKRHS